MARTRGWGGNPPAGDDEARARIIASAKRCLDRFGPAKTGLADIAADLEVTRQTVYRYFTTTDELIYAAAADSSGEFLRRLADHLGGIQAPDEILAEAITWTLEELPREPYIGILLQPSRRDNATVRMIDDQALTVGRTFLAQLAIDWDALEFGDQDLDELAELLLRLFTSYLKRPDTRRSRDELKQYFLRWIGAALRTSSTARA
ncbi:MAG TPA: TetR/AcrR family transcriptional regulator [Rugosimonospora sp.]|nr:TetR/AcrR family transcriptional regulator [Rugosimonospora sp.]